MVTSLIVLHVVICILLCVTVLLQFGKGAEAGAMMGGGASQAVFSSSAKGNFMTKLTTVLAVAFMVNSIVLTTLKSHESRSSLFDNEAPVAAPLNSDAENLNAKPTTPTTPAPTDAKASPVAPVPATTNPTPTQPVQQ
jgi:preprotein translocase subunit SecG